MKTPNSAMRKKWSYKDVRRDYHIYDKNVLIFFVPHFHLIFNENLVCTFLLNVSCIDGNFSFPERLELVNKTLREMKF